ncbi:MAG: hypothetical protein JXA57_17600 [Armatimonadetes bacterium]|nr:hypothetical protein [Armatimonadota bacterium]
MTEKHEPDTTAPAEKDELGFRDLSMNELPSAQPVSEDEAPAGGSRVGLLVITVLALVAFLVIGMRLISNAHPGQEAEARLRQRLMELPLWQQGTIMQAHYVAGDRVRLDFSQSLSTVSEEDRDSIRDATRETLLVLIKERPRRDLFVEGYQGEEEIVRGEYRDKSTLIGADGQPVPDIAVRLKGESGGLGGAFGASAGGRG